VRTLNAELYPYGSMLVGGACAFPTIGQAGRPAAPPADALGLQTAPQSASGYVERLLAPTENYGSELSAEVHRYSRLACLLSASETFDVIHAHDWMTYPAGIALAQRTGKPLIAHVHSTEFDRCGGSGNPWIHQMEYEGLQQAQQVITVSRYTQHICRARYNLSEAKCSVIHNGVDADDERNSQLHDLPPKTNPIVLFLGRITLQKGPEYFVAAARMVLEKIPEVKFIMAGNGDMLPRTIELAAQAGIGRNLLFAGFLNGAEVDRAFRMADLYIMPSVSEPFGIAPLEALTHSVPVIISKQSGVAEVLQHALKVDFWDVHEMANKIIAVLRHRPLRDTLRQNGAAEARNLTWHAAAEKCLTLYRQLTAAQAA
jgi:glycogen(starch) synthase